MPDNSPDSAPPISLQGLSPNSLGLHGATSVRHRTRDQVLHAMLDGRAIGAAALVFFVAMAFSANPWAPAIVAWAAFALAGFMQQRRSSFDVDRIADVVKHIGEDMRPLALAALQSAADAERLALSFPGDVGDLRRQLSSIGDGLLLVAQRAGAADQLLLRSTQSQQFAESQVAAHDQPVARLRAQRAELGIQFEEIALTLQGIAAGLLAADNDRVISVDVLARTRDLSDRVTAIAHGVSEVRAIPSGL